MGILYTAHLNKQIAVDIKFVLSLDSMPCQIISPSLAILYCISVSLLFDGAIFNHIIIKHNAFLLHYITAKVNNYVRPGVDT